MFLCIEEVWGFCWDLDLWVTDRRRLTRHNQVDHTAFFVLKAKGSTGSPRSPHTRIQQGWLWQVLQ